MMDLSLQEQILAFVTKFRVVTEKQIYDFFKEEWGYASLKYRIDYLKGYSYIFDQPGGRISRTRNLRSSMFLYEDTIRAIDVMCMLGSKNVIWFDSADYPSNIIYTTASGNLYEVTTFDERNIANKKALIQRCRQRRLFDIEYDPTNYIAVVPNEAMIPEIESIGFAGYAVMQTDGSLTMMFYEDEESDDT